jgi:hypothetical protein
LKKDTIMVYPLTELVEAEQAGGLLLLENKGPEGLAEKPSKLRPSNHTGAGPCYRAVRLFDMNEFAILFIIHP